MAEEGGQRIRGSRIIKPIAERPNKPASLWGFVKNFIGKDITKISMPVNFFEPLSFLQRLTEDFEYANLLDEAAKCTDVKQITYVSAFAVSCYSTTSDRTGKPFNPLLGETYECDRTSDLGWKCISEQVSHHPPISALHCEGKEWLVWQEFSMASKFRGKSIAITPIGIIHLLFTKSKNHYTWNKVNTTVHNIIIGQLWIEQLGTMIITNNKIGWTSKIEFLPFNYYNKNEQCAIKGLISVGSEVKYVINGHWNSEIEVASVVGVQGTKDKPIYDTGTFETIWVRKLRPGDSHKFYNFTLLASQLNEFVPNVAPTDSRYRPDQRLMEEGLWEEANKVKNYLEECQRERKAQNKSVKPLWFELKKDTISGEKVYTFNGQYWQRKSARNWSACPEIFNLPSTSAD